MARAFHWHLLGADVWDLVDADAEPAEPASEAVPLQHPLDCGVVPGFLQVRAFFVWGNGAGQRLDLGEREPVLHPPGVVGQSWRHGRGEETKLEGLSALAATEE